MPRALAVPINCTIALIRERLATQGRLPGDDALLSWRRVGAFVAAIQRSVVLGGPCSRLDRRHATGVDGDRAALGRIIGVQARRPGGGTGTGGRRIVAFLGALRWGALLRPSQASRDRE